MAKLIPKIVKYIRMLILSTFIFGVLLLYFFLGGDFTLMSPTSVFGVTISAGVAVALLVGALALAVVFPSFNKMATLADAALKSGQPPSPEMAKYAKRARIGSMLGALLLLLVLVMMVTAGFYPNIPI